MVEHASEIMPALFWSVWALVTVIAGGIRWAVLEFRKETREQTKAFTDHLEQQDMKLAAIKDLLADEVFKLREMIHGIDKRVLTIEGHCSLFHGHGLAQNPQRRHGDDPQRVAFPHYPD